MASCEDRMKGVSAPAGPGRSRHAGLTGRPWSLLHTAAQPCLPSSLLTLAQVSGPHRGPHLTLAGLRALSGLRNQPFSKQPASCKPGLTGPGPAFRTQKRAKASSVKPNNDNYMPPTIENCLDQANINLYAHQTPLQAKKT